jgi:asparagine synthetase B (glutamine-hydrolysing)
MKRLLELLGSAVEARSRHHRVALLLSGGIDSLSVGMALEALRKDVMAYTFELDGHHSKDRESAEAVARHFGWRLKILTVPCSNVVYDFVCLAVEHGCQKKVQFEVSFPLLHVFPLIAESEVWSGFNADDHYGNTGKHHRKYWRMAKAGVSHAERKKAFDDERREVFRKLEDPNSGDTWWFAWRIAARNEKQLLDPYLDHDIRKYFLQFNHEQLSSPKKPLIREALGAYFLANLRIATGVRLQIGSGVDALFETLIEEPYINRFEKKYTSISALCQRWGKEVQKNRDALQTELALIRRDCPTRMRIGGHSCTDPI